MVGYGLIGRKIGHSFSASYFSEKFKREQVDAEYGLYPLDSIEMLPDLLDAHRNLVGLNVTIPFKRDVVEFIPYGNLTPEVHATGAVNTLRISRKPDGKIFMIEGHNTDVEGFRESLRRIVGDRKDIRESIVLGASGGAAGAVRYVLKNDFGMRLTCVSRDCKENIGVDWIRYEDITPLMVKEHKLIVNCTPLGMWPDIKEEPALPYHALTPEHIGFDLIYNPNETLFLSHFKDVGAIAVNGLEMLRLQAEASYRFWTGA